MICSKITTTKTEKTRILKGFFSISNKTNEKKIRFPVIPKKLIKSTAKKAALQIKISIKPLRYLYNF